MNDEKDPSSASSDTWKDRAKHWQNRDYFEWARTPGINPMKVVAVVAGFAVFPPLGVAALVYFLWKSKRDRWNSEYAYAGGHGHGHRHGCGRGRHRWTGNAAFDAHQEEVMENLRAEREAFRTFREEQRRKRDQEAYDAFRAARTPAAETPPQA